MKQTLNVHRVQTIFYLLFISLCELLLQHRAILHLTGGQVYLPPSVLGSSRP